MSESAENKSVENKDSAGTFWAMALLGAVLGFGVSSHLRADHNRNERIERCIREVERAATSSSSSDMQNARYLCRYINP